MITSGEFLDQRAIVASGPSPVGLVHTVDGHPSGVALGHLSRLLATDVFGRVRQREFCTRTDWDAVVEFVETAVGPIKFQAIGEWTASLFAHSDEVGVSVRLSHGDYDVHVAATTDENASKWMAAFAELFPPPTPPPPIVRPDNVVPVAFWTQNPQSREGYARRRDITVTRFAEVAQNYPAALRPRLAKLMGMGAPSSDGSGKLILLHGPPGTGKTRSILALISEWREWCSASVVTDADRFFGDADYINSIVFGAQGMRDWLLLVIEDGDEYLNVSGRETKGQAIARLLNLADGIVGQGIQLLTLISTNVPMGELNPAIVRPGRCLANLHFGTFTADEAGEWLAGNGREGMTVDGTPTLAELYAALRDTDTPEVI